MKPIIIAVCAMIVAGSAYAEIYKWVDERGRTHISDRKPDKKDVKPLELNINTYTSVSYGASSIDHGKKVVMYATDWCGYCKKARKYFKKNNIQYTEYDIEKDVSAKRRYDKMGATGVPVIIVGKQRMNGFSVGGFERIYR